MTPVIRPSKWPVIVKLPVLVAVLLVVVSTVVTNQVLNRLADSQERHFRELTEAYLDGLSSSVIPAVLREDTWETFDILDHARSLYRGLTVIDTIVAKADGIVLAASNPRAVIAHARVPVPITKRFAEGRTLWIDENYERAGVRRVLAHQGREIGAIFAEFDVAALFRERRIVLWTLLGTNATITLLLVVAGYAAVRRILRPIDILSHFMNQGTFGPAPPIPESRLGPGNSEFGRLFRRYNAMVLACNEREALAGRLAEEERLASLGRLASGMAHEINNPLGGLLNALETVKRHGQDRLVRERAVSLLDRGIAGIRDVVRSALVTYRVDAADRALKPADVDDLRLLAKPEIERRSLELVWDNELSEDIRVSAGAVRQALLNLLLNACQASPPGGRIRFEVRRDRDRLIVSVGDQGPGLDPARASYLEDRGQVFAPRLGETGLGLWIVRRLVGEAGGSVKVEATPGSGTTIRVAIPVGSKETEPHVAVA